MKKYSFIILSLAGMSLMGTNLKSQTGLPITVQTLQNELIKTFESSGYGDYEIDLIHQKLGLLIPKLKDRMVKDSNGEECLKLEVTSGQFKHPNGDYFLVYGNAYLYPGSEPGKLNKIVVEYIRQNASGSAYKVEKRELINPTPVFNGENSVDQNTDIILGYHESSNPNVEYKKIRETTMGNIDRHDKKMKLINAYKDYIRKTLFALERNITGIELANVTELLYMLEFE